MTISIASGKETAARLGAAWGAGHAVTLFVFGVPFVLYEAYLPETLQTWAETAVGFVIVALARALGSVGPDAVAAGGAALALPARSGARRRRLRFGVWYALGAQEIVPYAF